jgi:hypothetical protein
LRRNAAVDAGRWWPYLRAFRWWRHFQPKWKPVRRLEMAYFGFDENLPALGR